MLQFPPCPLWSLLIVLLLLYSFHVILGHSLSSSLVVVVLFAPFAQLSACLLNVDCGYIGPDKLQLLLLGGSRQARIMVRAVSHASHYHFGNLSRAPFYQVVDAERGDHFGLIFIPVPQQDLQSAIISCSVLIAF